MMNSWNLELLEFENDRLAPSKRHSTLLSLIFIETSFTRIKVGVVLGYTIVYSLYSINSRYAILRA